MKWSDYKSNNNIHNPWNSVNCNNLLADGDANQQEIIGKNKQQAVFGTNNYVQIIEEQKPNTKLTFDCLPEPFSGSPDANVYCLNMNPGEPDPLFDKAPLVDNLYTQKAIANLKHNVPDAFWTEGLVIDQQGKITTIDNNLFYQLISDKRAATNYYIHEGARWQNEKTKELRKELKGQNPKVFFLEYFPYHSNHGFVFPEKLPSYEYRNSLLEFAMNENKLIIIMRQEKLWYKITERNIGKRLEGYKRKILLKCGQGAWLSRNNMLLPIPDFRCESMSWSDIISMM